MYQVFIQQMLYSVSSQNVLDDEEVNGIYKPNKLTVRVFTATQYLTQHNACSCF